MWGLVGMKRLSQGADDETQWGLMTNVSIV